MERTISDSTLVEDTNHYGVLYSAPSAKAEAIGNFFSKHGI